MGVRKAMANLQGFSKSGYDAMINHYTRHQDDPDQTKYVYRLREKDKDGRGQIDPDLTFLNYAIFERDDPKKFVQDMIASVDTPIRDSGKRQTNVMSDWVITLPKNEKLIGREREFFETAYEFMKTKVPEELMLGAWVHMDEKGMPHSHNAFCSIIETPVMTNDKKHPLRDGKGKIKRDKKGTIRYKRVPKLDANGNPIMKRSFGQSKMFDQAALKSFHPELEAYMEKHFGFKVGIELEDEGEKILSRLSQPEYIKAKETLERQQAEIVATNERLEVLQQSEDELGDTVELLQGRVDAEQAAAVSLGDIVGAKEESRLLGDRIDVLEAEIRASKREAADLAEQTRRVDGDVGRELVGLEERRGRAASLRKQALVNDRESSRLEKVCSVLSGALNRPSGRIEAVIQALTLCIRTDDFRRSTWPSEQKAAAEAEARDEMAKIKPAPAEGRVRQALAKAEAGLEKLKCIIRHGFRPAKGRFEETKREIAQLETQTPEAMQEQRNFEAQRFIDVYAASIQRARGPEKADLIAKLGEIANDRSLSGRVRSSASRRISWIKDGAPSGAPAGAGTPAPTQHRGPQATYGGEARTIERGAR